MDITIFDVRGLLPNNIPASARHELSTCSKSPPMQGTAHFKQLQHQSQHQHHSLLRPRQLPHRQQAQQLQLQCQHHLLMTGLHYRRLERLRYCSLPRQRRLQHRLHLLLHQSQHQRLEQRLFVVSAGQVNNHKVFWTYQLRRHLRQYYLLPWWWLLQLLGCRSGDLSERPC